MIELSALTLKVRMVSGIDINHRTILEGPGPPGPTTSKPIPQRSISLVDVTVPSLYKGKLLLSREVEPAVFSWMKHILAIWRSLSLRRKCISICLTELLERANPFDLRMKGVGAISLLPKNPNPPLILQSSSQNQEYCTVLHPSPYPPFRDNLIKECLW